MFFGRLNILLSFIAESIINREETKDKMVKKKESPFVVIKLVSRLIKFFSRRQLVGFNYNQILN